MGEMPAKVEACGKHFGFTRTFDHEFGERDPGKCGGPRINDCLAKALTWSDATEMIVIGTARRNLSFPTAAIGVTFVYADCAQTIGQDRPGLPRRTDADRDAEHA
ncbi:MAG: hypothetical protein ACJ8EN_23180 [Xanthobacteraceae bacterium]